MEQSLTTAKRMRLISMLMGCRDLEKIIPVSQHLIQPIGLYNTTSGREKNVRLLIKINKTLRSTRDRSR